MLRGRPAARQTSEEEREMLRAHRTAVLIADAATAARVAAARGTKIACDALAHTLERETRAWDNAWMTLADARAQDLRRDVVAAADAAQRATDTHCSDDRLARALKILRGGESPGDSEGREEEEEESGESPSDAEKPMATRTRKRRRARERARVETRRAAGADFPPDVAGRGRSRSCRRAGEYTVLVVDAPPDVYRAGVDAWLAERRCPVPAEVYSDCPSASGGGQLMLTFARRSEALAAKEVLREADPEGSCPAIATFWHDDRLRA